MSSPETPLLYLSSILIKLVNLKLRDTLPSFILSLLVTANSVKDAHGSIPTTILRHIESIVI
jgi:hypothetical protein